MWIIFLKHNDKAVLLIITLNTWTCAWGRSQAVGWLSEPEFES